MGFGSFVFGFSRFGSVDYDVDNVIIINVATQAGITNNMATTIWNNIHQNFKDFLEDSVTGVGVLINIKNVYREATDSIKLDTQPASVFNGKFSTQLYGLTESPDDIGSSVRLDYDVLLQLSYNLSTKASKNSYNDAISDIEEIIRKRIDVSTFQGANIENIRFLSCSPFRFLDVKTEEFAIIDILFRVTGRTYITNS